MAMILSETIDQITTLTLNRPEQLNVLNAELLAEFSDALDQIDLEKTRCVILTGSGNKAFAAGADISAMVTMSADEAHAFGEAGNALMHKIENLPVPVIAAVHGFALGGGCELALCCDIRLASEKAAFSLPETSLGIIPGFGGTQRLARLVGPALAKELIFTGRRVQASEAGAIGLVNGVFPVAEFREKVQEMARQIAANGPIAIRAAKAAINQGLQLDIQAGTALETELFAACFETQDQHNAMQAFVTKAAKPAFINC